ncbi:hypothetical protein CEXT_210951 [Caerostris extrusa]|uniref:Uncharacterized protein n=1 Tax=Caerostris extrusa TaxID=172846 RepID=A0AAV4MAD5_CAEEX|nr:hypothetical protein CEXT_210951 [Caerostris extrusa]
MQTSEIKAQTDTKVRRCKYLILMFGEIGFTIRRSSVPKCRLQETNIPFILAVSNRLNGIGLLQHISPKDTYINSPSKHAQPAHQERHYSYCYSESINIRLDCASLKRASKEDSSILESVNHH